MDGYEAARSYWKKKAPATTDELDAALDSYRILFAYHSGRIENPEVDYHDTREIFENGRVTSFAGMPRTLFEQQNQKLCYEYLLEKIILREPLTIGLTLEIHKILTSGTYDEHRYIARGERPGEFKKHDYVTGRLEVGYAPEEVEPALRELYAELGDLPGSADMLTAGAYLHAVFEHIHPFADGNGRVGRTLLNYFLMTHGEPPLIIYEEDRKQYYAALERFDEAEELDALRVFLQSETAKTWVKTLERENGKRRETKKLGELER